MTFGGGEGEGGGGGVYEPHTFFIIFILICKLWLSISDLWVIVRTIFSFSLVWFLLIYKLQSFSFQMPKDSLF